MGGSDFLRGQRFLQHSIQPEGSWILCFRLYAFRRPQSERRRDRYQYWGYWMLLDCSCCGGVGEAFLVTWSQVERENALMTFSSWSEGVLSFPKRASTQRGGRIG
jgi:hypothetical protein